MCIDGVILWLDASWVFASTLGPMNLGLTSETVVVSFGDTLGFAFGASELLLREEGDGVLDSPRLETSASQTRAYNFAILIAVGSPTLAAVMNQFVAAAMFLSPSGTASSSPCG